MSGDVKITMTMAQAESLSNGMSDLLCWVRGYMVASDMLDGNSPIGQDEVREMRIFLKSAMRKAEK